MNTTEKDSPTDTERTVAAIRRLLKDASDSIRNANALLDVLSGKRGAKTIVPPDRPPPDDDPNLLISPANSAARASDEPLLPEGRHRLTPDEYDAYVRQYNAQARGDTIPDDVAQDFWNFMVASEFVNRNNEVITRGNVRTTSRAWRDCRRREDREAERRERNERERANEAAKASEESRQLISRYMLAEVPED